MLTLRGSSGHGVPGQRLPLTVDLPLRGRNLRCPVQPKKTGPRKGLLISSSKLNFGQLLIAIELLLAQSNRKRAFAAKPIGMASTNVSVFRFHTKPVQLQNKPRLIFVVDEVQPTQQPLPGNPSLSVRELPKSLLRFRLNQ